MYVTEEEKELLAKHRVTARANRKAAQTANDKRFDGFCSTHGWTRFYTTSAVCTTCASASAARHRSKKSPRKTDANDAALGGDPKDLIIKSRRFGAILRPGGEIRWYNSESAARTRGRKEWKAHLGFPPR